MRAGTAATITPENYDQQRRELTFTTKYGRKQTLVVTEEIARILAAPGFVGNAPYVKQVPRPNGQTGRWSRPTAKYPGRTSYQNLAREFKRLRLSLGITRKLTAHDLRRTTATRLYSQTHDLRAVQALLGHTDLNSTLWYLDHNMTPVAVSSLELAKLNPETEVVQ